MTWMWADAPAVADALGDGWTALPQPGRTGALLTRPGKSVFLSLSLPPHTHTGTACAGQVEAALWIPDPGGGRHRAALANIAVSRGPVQVAGEIRRRLLPRLRHLEDAEAAALARRRDAAAARAGVVDRVRSALGPLARGRDEPGRLDVRAPAGARGPQAALTGDVRVDPHGGRVDLVLYGLTPDAAELLARTLADHLAPGSGRKA